MDKEIWSDLSGVIFMDDNKENVITYETFRKFQRYERDNKQLQKLPEDFYQSCAEWMKRKEKIYEETKDPMIIKEIENVMTIIKDILDRRERKLLLLAMHSVRGNAVPQNLLPFEAKHFDIIVEHLREMREGILSQIKGTGEEKSGEEKKEEPKEEEPEEKTEDIKKEEKVVEKEAEEETKKEEEVAEELKKDEKLPKIKQIDGFKLVRILDEIPQFLGTDGRIYGPFKPEDLVTLEEKVADLIINKNKAEPVNI